MSALDDLRAAVVATLNTVPNIGKVHDYERFAKQEGEFRTLYLHDLGGGAQQIRGWHVRRVATRRTHETGASREDFITWRIRGFMSLDDGAASEKTFDNLIEAVLDAFDASAQLSALNAYVYSPNGEGPELEEHEPVMLGGVLCHQARIKLITTRLY